MITIRNRLKSTRIEDQFKGKSITKRNSQWIWFDCTFACILSTQKKTKLFCFERQNNILFKICVPYQSTPDYSMHSNAHNKLFFYLRISLHHFAIGFLCHLPLSLATLSYITRIKETIFTFQKTHFARYWPHHVKVFRSRVEKNMSNLARLQAIKHLNDSPLQAIYYSLQDTNFYGIFEEFIFTGVG